MGDYKSCQTTSAKLCTRYGKIGGRRRIKKQASSKRKVCQKKKGKNVSFRYKIIVSNFKKSFKKCEEANKKLSFCGQFMKNQFHPIVKNWACMAKFSRILLVVSRNVTLKKRRFVTGISTK